ncbi:unnamed protein product [Mesocestoides corti]|uniref:Secreted protein n=1 Tax=Mesocestoides corti TaxID=53468 RepID=A0A0R3U8Y2_MESCO|nr:unnamed protein product [Mesocestoides corti]
MLKLVVTFNVSTLHHLSCCPPLTAPLWHSAIAVRSSQQLRSPLGDNQSFALIECSTNNPRILLQQMIRRGLFTGSIRPRKETTTRLFMRQFVHFLCHSASLCLPLTAELCTKTTDRHFHLIATGACECALQQLRLALYKQ